jgi:hypothetical protein
MYAYGKLWKKKTVSILVPFKGLGCRVCKAILKVNALACYRLATCRYSLETRSEVAMFRGAKQRQSSETSSFDISIL